MSKDEILAAIAVLALAGAIVYIANIQQNNTAGAIVIPQEYQADLESDGNNEPAFNVGPADYLAAAPYLFQIPLGNIVPPLSAPNQGSVASNAVNNTSSNQLSPCLGCGG